MLPLRISILLLAAVFFTAAHGQVVINEIHYHPVEQPAFNADGTPQIDLTEDVHEFVELYNAGAGPVDLSGWKLTSGVEFTMPPATQLAAGGYIVIAHDKARLETVYGITGVLGGFIGKLSNSGETVRLKNAAGETVDAVSYSASFPWPTGADALGADDDFTLINSATYQYKGRSLQRVSAAAGSSDPANWLASPLGSAPTPGAANAVTRETPKPVVVAFRVTQGPQESTIIRSGQLVKVTCQFSSAALVANPQIEYFVDDRNSFAEARSTVPLTPAANGQFTAILPSQADRAVVRFRIQGDRGDGMETISPRADDVAIVPVSASSREAWHAYFATPVRTSPNPIYDVFIADGSLSQLNTNISQSPKRVTSSAITGLPRAVPYVAPTAPLWNGTKPAVFVHNGVVRDIQLRYHGSRYNRTAGRNSWKVQFAETQKFDGTGSFFVTDKGDYFTVGQGIFIAGNLPVSECHWVDWYLNANGKLNRLQQGEYDGDLLESYQLRMHSLNPATPQEEAGEFYKSVGTIETNGEGPYGRGDERLLPAGGPWSELQRYDWTYSLQNHGWKGPKPIRDMLVGLWAARGDTFSAPNPNIAQLTSWMSANFDVETELNSLAILNWMCPWDDTTQNHLLWRRASGKWASVPWDFDGYFGNGDNTGSGSSIYLGEVGLPSSYPGNNFRGPNFLKDSFFKAFRQQYKDRFWVLNNTFLHPENLKTIFYKDVSGASRSYYAFINGVKAGFCEQRFQSVNTQTGHAANGSDFLRPVRPVNQAPASNRAVLPPASLVSSAYTHSSGNTDGVNAHARSTWQIRASTGNYQLPVYQVTTPIQLTSLPIPFADLTVGATYFWRVTYIDGQDHPSLPSVESSFVFGPTGAATIVINEVLSINRATALNGGAHPDYVELLNTTGAPVDVSGWGLTDDLQAPPAFLFPAGTSIAAGGYLTVWCDTDFAAPGLHAGFRLSGDGQLLALVQGNSVRDFVEFGPQATDWSIGRIPNGTGSFTLILPSLGEANAGATLGSISTLKLNEWMAEPANGEDWFEIYNADANPVALAGLFVSDTPSDPTITRIPNLSFIAGNGYTVFKADGSNAAANHANFKLASTGDSLVLTSATAATSIDFVTFGPQTGNVSQGRLPDGLASDNFRFFPQSLTPGASNYLPAPVAINEALTNPTAPFEDAIEFRNTSDSPVPIGGWWLSDDETNLQKYRLPSGATVSAGGYAVVYENQFNAAPAVGTPFALSALGDALYLSAVDGQGNLTGYRAQVRFGAASANVSFGRIATAQGFEFWPLLAPTFGQDNPATVAEFRAGTGNPNAAAKTGPVVINEVMYHPPDGNGGTDDTLHEFIELHNITTSGVDIAGWKMRGESDFTFPGSSIIRPGDYVLLVNFSATDADSAAAFRAHYNLPGDTVLYGPFAPKLSNGAQLIELVQPQAPVGAEIPYVMVDRVEYADVSPWPLAPDGGGQSLQRMSRTVIGNDAANWAPGAPTPGLVNNGEAPIADSDGDGMADSYEFTYGFDRFDRRDAAPDTDGDGRTNREEAAAGTDPRNGASFFVSTVVKIAGGYEVRWLAQSNVSYSVFYQDQLGSAWTKVPNGDWSPQSAAQPAAVTDLTDVSARFYKVVTPRQ